MIDANHLCPGCMHFWPDPSRSCEHCGFSWENRREEGRCLPVFTILAGKYLLGVKIGAGGFGITYLAMDLNEEIPVAVKEFFPVSLAERDGEQVRALPQEEGRVFREALRSFRREADLMARFCGVEGLAGYRDFVEENGTAYLVMDYIEGSTLKQYMKETCRTFSQQEAQRLMAPVLRAVETMHAGQVLHRDISPENLILGPDGKLTLIDFGAAREYSPGEEENLTVILKRGYAPEEQYHTGSRQGPWTDLYACCAVLYQMVSGILPQDAGQRKEKDRLIPLDEIPGVEVTWQFARAIEKGMTVRAVERYPSIRALRKDLGMEEAESGQQEERTVVRQPDGRRDVSRQGRQPGKTEFSGTPAGQEISPQEKSPGEPVRQAETSKRALPDPVWMVGLALFLVAAWIVATVLSGGRGRRTDWAEEGAASESLQTGEGERDEYGNLLFAGTVLYEYAEYQVEDGIYAPTGRTSGSSDTAAAEEGTGGQSWENQEEEAVLSVIGVLADNGLQADSLDRPTQLSDPEAVLQALEQGLLDAVTGRVKEHDFSSCALVYPSAEWISADGGIWTVAAKDMDTCWRITELLRDAGYYSNESAAGGFLASLEMGEAHAVYRESDPFLRGIMEQYLVYWEAQTGMSWEIVDE